MTVTHIDEALGAAMGAAPGDSTGAFWRDEGLCSPTAAARARTEGRVPVVADPDVFFDSTMSARAKRICAECPVRETCLAHALAHNERYGIWGGTTPFDRRKMKRAMREQDRRDGTGIDVGRLVVLRGGRDDSDERPDEQDLLAA